MTPRSESRGARCSRRAVLGLAGAGLVSVPFIRALSEAVAAEPGPVLERYVGVFMPHGVARELFTPRAGFELTYPDAVLAPFDAAASLGRSLRDDLLVIEGLDLSAGIKGGSAGHEGSRVLLTGSARDARNASLDQFLAVERGFGALTPLPSLVLGVGEPQAATSLSISYGPGGVPLPKLIDPSETHARAIAQWIVGSDAASLERAARDRRRGLSVLDALRADLRALEERAGSSQRLKLEQHVDALRVLETKLQGFELACTPPAAPDPVNYPRIRAYQGGEPYFDAVTNLQIDILVAALACGVTRFATLYLADLSHTGIDPELPDDIHEGVAHRYRAATPSAEGDPETWRLLARQNAYACSKVARLAARLADSGLLDTTLVHATSDMGDPARHDSRNIPTLLVGGRAAGIRSGRHLDVRQNLAGVPNNRLLVSISQAFGVELEAFGEAADPELTRGSLDLRA